MVDKAMVYDCFFFFVAYETVSEDTSTLLYVYCFGSMKTMKCILSYK